MDAYFAGLRNLETEASLITFLNEVTRTFGHIVQVCTTLLQISTSSNHVRCALNTMPLRHFA